MGAAKDMWMNEVERVGEDFAAGVIDRDDAMATLKRLGFSATESSDMLDEASA